VGEEESDSKESKGKDWGRGVLERHFDLRWEWRNRKNGMDMGRKGIVRRLGG